LTKNACFVKRFIGLIDKISNCTCSNYQTNL
jgi:hypothetical protein